MNNILSILLHRNMILIGAIFIGLFYGEMSAVLKDYNIYILALVMTFSTTSITFKSLLPFNQSIRIMSRAFVLGYVVFSSVLLLVSAIFIRDEYLFYGMIVIAASPPGVAVIPFTHILKGDMRYTMIATIGVYLASIVIAPLIIFMFSGSSSLSPVKLLIIMVEIIVLPFLFSRLLMHNKIYTYVARYRGKIIDLGFAVIIYTAVGLNRSVFFNDFKVLALIFIVLFISVFGLGFLYEQIMKNKLIDDKIKVSEKLLLTVKSSGFTASTSLAIFGKEATIPSAVLAVLVLAYLLYLSIRVQFNK